MNKIKKLIGMLLGLSMVAGIGFVTLNGNHVFPTFADRPYECYGNVRIETDGNTYEVTHIGGDATTVVIPSEINGIPVTYISADAFDDCRDTLTSITIDGSIPVEEGAFDNMENVIDVTFTGDMTELNYGHIFENTEIGTMTIPGTVTYVNPEMFYCVTDTTTLVYEGTFSNFWGSNGSDGIFGSLWTAFQETREKQTGSMPTNIVVNGKTYTATALYSDEVRYYNSKNRDAFGYKNNNYYRNYNNTKALTNSLTYAKIYK